MVKVVGMWEFGWDAPLTESSQWVFPLRDFNVDELYMCPITGIRSKLSERKQIRDVIDENPNLIKVFVDERGETDLRDFEHPENVLYILGKVGYSPLSLKKDNDFSIKIKTKEDKGLLWASQACVLVLYDRFLKNGSNNI